MSMGTGGKVAVVATIGGAAALLIAGVASASKAGTVPPTGGGAGSCNVSSSCSSGQICLDGSCVSATLTLSASESQYTPGGTVSFVANLKASGNTVANYEIILDEITSGSTASSITDLNGNATFNVAFPSSASGDYSFEAKA